MKKIFALFALAFLLSATSCLNDDGNQQNKQSFVAECYNKISYDGELKITSAKYLLEFDFVSNTVSVTTSDTEISASSYKIVDLPLSVSNDKGYYFTSAAPRVTNTAGVDLPALTITNFYGEYTGVSVKFSYTVNGDTFVYASYVEDTYSKLSKTVVSSPQGGEPFVWDDASYKFTLKAGDVDAKAWSATMVVNNVKFSSYMPYALNDMSVEGLLVTPTSNGLKYTADKVVPKLQNVEQPDYTLTDIEVNVMPSFSPTDLFIHEYAVIKFTCKGLNVEANAYVYQQQ